MVVMSDSTSSQMPQNQAAARSASGHPGDFQIFALGGPRPLFLLLCLLVVTQGDLRRGEELAAAES